MSDFGWLKNKTKIDQSFGNYTIAPQTVGLVPLTVIENLRQYPDPNFVIIEDHPEEWCFHRTNHLPWSPRYQNHDRYGSQTSHP